MKHIESMDEEELAKMSNNQLEETASRATNAAQAVAVRKKKRGATHKHLTMEEEMAYMVYKMITDLFNFEELKKKSDFAIKRYKESLYRG